MIQLYRKGNTHTVRGVECELRNFDAAEIDLRLAEGWVKDTSDLAEKPKKEKKEKKEKAEETPEAE